MSEAVVRVERESDCGVGEEAEELERMGVRVESARRMESEGWAEGSDTIVEYVQFPSYPLLRGHGNERMCSWRLMRFVQDVEPVAQTRLTFVHRRYRGGGKAALAGV